MFYNLKNMKKFLLFICILCNCISAHSQMVGKGSLGYYGLRGPVKTCKEIGENWECTHAFDKNGVLTAVDGETVRSNPPSYEFNANGRISRFFPIPENPNLYEKYEYDAYGNWTKRSMGDITTTRREITYYE